MLTASAGFATAVTQPAQTVACSVVVDLPGYPATDLTACVTSLSLDTQVQTDLPDGIRDVEGFGTIGGSLTLAGRLTLAGGTWSIVDLLNPDNAASPLYRANVKGSIITVKAGLYLPGSTTPELVPKLTRGRVAAIPSINHADGTVQLDLVDSTDSWGAALTIPGMLPPPWNIGATSEFVMDAALRSALGGSTWPAQHYSCICSAGMRTSLAPEVGTLTSFSTLDGYSGPTGPRFAPGRWGSALTGAAGRTPSTMAVTYRLARNVRPGEANMNFDFTATNSAQPYIVLGDSAGSGYINWYVVEIVGHTLFVQAHVNSDAYADSWSVTLPDDTAAHRIRVGINYPPPSAGAAGWAVTVGVDGVPHASGWRSIGARSTTAEMAYVTVTMTGDGSGTFEAFQVDLDFGITTDTFTPRAVLDPSLNPLTVIPPIEPGTKALELIQTAAAAELGYARVDETDVFRFSNRQNLASMPLARVVSETVSLKSAETSIGSSTQYNHLQVPFTAWTIAAPSAAWTLSDARHIPRGGSTTWLQQLDQPTAAIAATGARLPNAHTYNDGGTWFRASTDTAGSAEVTGLAVAVAVVTPNTVQITVTNPTSRDAYLVSPANYSDLTVGTPALWVGGNVATPADEAATDSVYGAADSLFAVSSNPFLQSRATATTVGAYLLNQLFLPIRDFTNVAIVPDPRIQAADLLRLQSPSRNLDEYVHVWAWSFSADFPAPGDDGGSWDQTVDVRALAPPGAWLAGIAGRSEVGTTNYAYS